MKRFLLLLSACCLTLALQGQETAPKAIPDEVFYLMPSFTQGTIFLRGQPPAQGMLNICAVDQSLRFLDDNGTELSANDPDAIRRVQLDTVSFLRSDGAFYRLYPVSPETGVALRRDVRILRDVNQGAFGTTNQTSSIRQYSTLYTDGASQQLNRDGKRSYVVSETVCVYCRDAVFKLTKANLKKIFPDRKDEIEARFKSGKSLPDTVEEASALLRLLNEGSRALE
jgi:hypothetical protein